MYSKIERFRVSFSKKKEANEKMRILCITFFWKNFIFHAIKCPLAALYAYVLSLTKNKYDTEDVLQEPM